MFYIYSCKKKARHNMVFFWGWNIPGSYIISLFLAKSGKILMFPGFFIDVSLSTYHISMISRVFPKRIPKNIYVRWLSHHGTTVLFPRFSEQFPSWKSRPSGYDIHSLPWKDPPFLRTVNPGKPSISIRAIYPMTRGYIKYLVSH